MSRVSENRGRVMGYHAAKHDSHLRYLKETEKKFIFCILSVLVSITGVLCRHGTFKKGFNDHHRDNQRRA